MNFNPPPFLLRLQRAHALQQLRRTRLRRPGGDQAEIRRRSGGDQAQIWRRSGADQAQHRSGSAARACPASSALTRCRSACRLNVEILNFGTA